MARVRQVAGVNGAVEQIAFTEQEETDRDAEEAASAQAAATATANAQVLEGFDTAITQQQYGSVSPATLAELKAMTNAQFGTWFDTNFTNNAQALALLKALTRIVLRKVLR